MDSSDPSQVDLTLTDPTAIAHVVADVLAGRCVRLTWSSRVVGDDLDAARGVTSTAVEVVGCWAAKHTQPPKLACTRADDDEFFLVPWGNLLSIGHRLGGDVAPAVQQRLTEVSRWFGHTVEITTRHGHRFIGRVVGFEYGNTAHGKAIDLLIVPLDHVRHPQMNEYAISVDQLETVLDLGT